VFSRDHEYKKTLKGIDESLTRLGTGKACPKDSAGLGLTNL